MYDVLSKNWKENDVHNLPNENIWSPYQDLKVIINNPFAFIFLYLYNTSNFCLHHQYNNVLVFNRKIFLQKISF